MVQRGFVIGVFTVSTLLLFSRPGAALINGITGFSGIRGPGGGAPICNKCHGGGATPVVRLDGPQVVERNQTASFQLTVESRNLDQFAAGLDVAASGGRLGAVDGEGERIMEGELTHARPRPNVAGVTTWSFTWTAPDAPGTYGLFAAGNSVNGDGKAGGDAAARTTLDVVVPGATFTAAPTATPTTTPSATPTPSSTPTPSPSPCTGDCDGDRRVAVDELIRGVSVSLQMLGEDACPNVDRDRDGNVSISELLSAVDHSLHGCQ